MYCKLRYNIYSIYLNSVLYKVCLGWCPNRIVASCEPVTLNFAEEHMIENHSDMIIPRLEHIEKESDMIIPILYLRTWRRITIVT